MKSNSVSRRRALTIIAAASAFPTAAAARNHRERLTWRGSVMGADASMTFYTASRDKALEAVDSCLAEVDRLENIFSLYRAHSEISVLNRLGKLNSASHDMRRLLGLSRSIGNLTGGAFDPTVQPIWRLNANWFTAHPGSSGPSPKDLAQACGPVDYRRIGIENARVVLGSGQAITLNGIAQGYITDRIADVLCADGWTNLLLNLGEYRAIAARPDGTPFRVGLAGNGATVSLTDRALATSAGTGFVFPSHSQDHTHLIDPKTGRSPGTWASVHVRHSSAAMADGLSTAFSSMTADEIMKTIERTSGTDLWARTLSGRFFHLRGRLRG